MKSFHRKLSPRWFVLASVFAVNAQGDLSAEEIRWSETSSGYQIGVSAVAAPSSRDVFVRIYLQTSLSEKTAVAFPRQVGRMSFSLSTEDGLPIQTVWSHGKEHVIEFPNNVPDLPRSPAGSRLVWLEPGKRAYPFGVRLSALFTNVPPAQYQLGVNAELAILQPDRSLQKISLSSVTSSVFEFANLNPLQNAEADTAASDSAPNGRGTAYGFIALISVLIAAFVAHRLRAAMRQGPP